MLQTLTLRGKESPSVTNTRPRDRGASLVEFALILPLLLLVLISIFEIGAAFRNYLTVSYLAREGARLSAFLGTDIDADCDMITGLATTMSPADLARLTNIQVFRADAAGNQVMTDTNTFTFTGANPANCAHWTSVVTWPSTSRQTTVSTSGIPTPRCHRSPNHDDPEAG